MIKFVSKQETLTLGDAKVGQLFLLHTDALCQLTKKGVRWCSYVVISGNNGTLFGQYVARMDKNFLIKKIFSEIEGIEIS